MNTYSLDRWSRRWDTMTREEKDQWNAEWFIQTMFEIHGPKPMRLVTSLGIVEITPHPPGATP